MAGNERPRAIGVMDKFGGRWTKETRLWIPEISAERKIKLDKLKQDLDLEEHARSDGRMNRPDTSDRTLNEPQLEVCNRIFSGILMLNQFLAEELGKALDLARRRVPRRLDLKDYRSRVNNQVSTVFAEASPDLTRLRFEDLAAQRDLRYFRHKNRLNRSAHYKDSHWLTIGLLFAMLVVESIANGLLFREVVRDGLLGGMFLAALISIINIVLGLFAGSWGWRNTSHVELTRRILGWSATIFIHGFALFWNLLVAHFREVAEASAQRTDFDFDLAQLATLGWQHLQEQGWFGIVSIFSWALLALGIIIHLLAAKEGWDDLADRYPDYMKVDKKSKEARALFDEALLEMRSDARDSSAEVIQEAEEECKTARVQANAIAQLLDLARQREKEVRDSEDEWVVGGTQLLKTYRDINLEIREDHTEPPAYFSAFPSAAEYRTRDFNAGGPKVSLIDEHVASAEENLSSLERLNEAAEELVQDNEKDLRELRAYVNIALEKLDRQVKGVKTAATAEAKEEFETLEGGLDGAKA